MAENKLLRCSCMNVQCDWNEAAAREAGQFWVSCKRPGSQTVHGHLRRNGDTIESVDDKFTVTYATPDSVTVQCNYTDGGCKTTFIRPVKTLHLHQKKVSTFDHFSVCCAIILFYCFS
ncbi:Proteasomal ATPase-associated factor 1 [Geodia barretti]|uniref:Proteasomal ATPase-associated factor 1 n=1 Tax=Geodia barretti TaxID=519541 RepID=A0AA35W448_GEOBA|nr:Proteasomal ATPase-associated factor 1 [Geodia barretti]